MSPQLFCGPEMIYQLFDFMPVLKVNKHQRCHAPKLSVSNVTLQVIHTEKQSVISVFLRCSMVPSGNQFQQADGPSLTMAEPHLSVSPLQIKN